jgi:tRNA nucleotidyltransferase (CCA-adding enzyme)
LRDPAALDGFLLACEADARGRTGYESATYDQGQYLRSAFAAASAVDSTDVPAGCPAGPDFGAALRALRIAAISEWLGSGSPA